MVISERGGEVKGCSASAPVLSSAKGENIYYKCLVLSNELGYINYCRRAAFLHYVHRWNVRGVV